MGTATPATISTESSVIWKLAPNSERGSRAIRQRAAKPMALRLLRSRKSRRASRKSVTIQKDRCTGSPKPVSRA